MSRIYLSPPQIGALEREYLLGALASNWVAPVGPDLDAFEQEVALTAGREHGVALTSGTAALHLALLVLGVGAGDEILLPTLTFVASANAVRYVGAHPVFLDSEEQSWNLDPEILEEQLKSRARRGQLPAAVIVVDLYGQCADYARLYPICEHYGVPLVEDAAEALGASHGERPAGSFGKAAVFSFNGNKIITTSGGGMLVTDDAEFARQVRHLATQAREPVLHYEHAEMGFNYRLSNLLAALGRAQLCSLDDQIRRRGVIQARYREALGGFDGIEFLPRAPWGAPNHWLTCMTVDPAGTRSNRDELIAALEEWDIEARPVWKPMHRQSLYRDAPTVLTGTADRLFDTGLCLPSGGGMSESDQERVVETVIRALRRR